MGAAPKAIGRHGPGRAHRAILVATALHEASVPALRRGVVLAEIFDARLHVLHVVSRISPALQERSEVTRDAVRRWAEADAQIVLPDDAVLVGAGDPADAITGAAEEVHADLVVIGRPGRDGATLDGLCRSPTRSILIADRQRNRGELVAATDMLDPKFPIVHSAARLARALEAHVTVVHNVEAGGPAEGVRLGTILTRVHSLERLACELASVRGAKVGATRATSDAIADVALARDADIVVVGVRTGHGRTLDDLLRMTLGRSVLAVPIEPAPVAA
jgi:nucleotide-binding universal stress UspA family protein